MKKSPFKPQKTEQTIAEYRIAFYSVTAGSLMRIGKMQEAYDIMNEAIQLIEQADKPGFMLSYVACQIMARICTKMNRYEEAVKYHQIVREYEEEMMEMLPIEEVEKMANITKDVAFKHVKSVVNAISMEISKSKIKEEKKEKYLERLSNLDLHLLDSAYTDSKAKITEMDMKYIICIAADIDVKDIGLLFNIEPESVYTMRYRVKKKFAENDTFRMIL